NNMKIRCRPIAENQQFFFHIDFDNLTSDELYLLLKSIEPDPAGKSRHRLGLGKPLGLGSVSLSVMMLSLTDRKSRYQDKLFSEEGGRENFSSSHWGKWKESQAVRNRYPELVKSSEDTHYDRWEEISDLSQPTVSRLVDRDALRQWLQGTNPDNIKNNTLITYPVTTDQIKQKNIEENLFKWFTENDKSKKYSLGKLTTEVESLPTLPTLIPPSSKKKGGYNNKNYHQKPRR
ncbi:MAG: hypothetical protein HQL48_09750, partial [Gammaproteobacteria bacterium]|nr:hypothetical protein [Gammaproteobacteria bacterium]